MAPTGKTKKRGSGRETKKNGGEKKVKEDAIRTIGTFRVVPLNADRKASHVCIQCALKEKGIDIAIASRSATPDFADAFLEKLGIKSLFVTKEIGHSSTHKRDHFQRIHSTTGIPFNSMLFFDDDIKNTQSVSGMGVTSILVSNGLDLDAMSRGLTEFSANWSKSEKSNL